MMKHALLIAIVAALSASCSAFSIPVRAIARTHIKCHGHIRDGNDESSKPSSELSRRSAIFSTFALPLSVLLTSTVGPLRASAGDKGKVVVLGGAGWVGAHVSADLDKKGYKVVSISRSTADAQIERTKSILGTTISGVEYKSLDAGTASVDDLLSVMKDSVAVVSCVGISPGSKDQKDGNGLVNTRIAKAAKAAGVPKLIYIGVSSALANGPAKFLLGDYFQGKAEAEKSVVQEFGENSSLIIKPAIIAGGPPGEIRPPGPPGVKPVDVEAVAKAIVAGVEGNLIGEIDGNDAITAL